MSDLSNQSTATLDRWVHEGQVTDVPRALFDDPVGNSEFSSRWIDDGSYLRLKYLTLAYTIAEKKWFFRNLEVSISATNLFTWSNYLGYDPEFSFSYYTMEQGIDYGMMPHTRNFILGLRVGL
jgi:trans-2-enoyl-CoA reductase